MENFSKKSNFPLDFLLTLSYNIIMVINNIGKDEKPMNTIKEWNEVMKLIAQYDWAVEGFPAPEGTELTREEAVEVRNALVKVAGQF